MVFELHLQLAGRVLATLFKCMFNLKILFNMWKFTLSDGTVVIGYREQIAKWLNFFDDVYDDDVWDEFCSYYKVEWIDEDEEAIIIEPLVKRNNEEDDDDIPF